MVLWGDSHAWMIIPAIEAAAEDATSTSSRSSWVAAAVPRPRAPIISCVRNNEMALNFVAKRADARSRPREVILSASWPTYLNGLNLMIARGGDRAHERYIEQISQLFRDGTPQSSTTCR